jgi:hypothetical protein
MSSVGTSKGVLEIAKFGLYVSVPIVLMYAFANNTKNLQRFMGNVTPSLCLSISLCSFFAYGFAFLEVPFPVYGSEFI